MTFRNSIFCIFICVFAFQGCLSPTVRPVTSGLDLEFLIDKDHQRYELTLSNKLSEEINIPTYGDIPLVSVWVVLNDKTSNEFVTENYWDVVFGDLSEIGSVIYPEKKIKPGETVPFFLFPKKMRLYDSKRQTLEEFLKMGKIESILAKLPYRGGSGSHIAGELTAVGAVTE